MLVLRTRQERTERRLRHKKEANPPPMEPPALLINNNHLYLDLNMNFSENCKEKAARAVRKVGLISPRATCESCKFLVAFQDPREPVVKSRLLKTPFTVDCATCGHLDKRIVTRFLTKTLPSLCQIHLFSTVS